jgi:hypothetical protein
MHRSESRTTVVTMILEASTREKQLVTWKMPAVSNYVTMTFIFAVMQ